MQQLVSFQRIKILRTAVFPIRVIFPVQVSVDQPPRYKITFLQAYLQPLLHILLVNGQLLGRHGGLGNHFLHHRQQFAHMFTKTMHGDGSRFIITGPVDISPVILKIFIQLKSGFCIRAIT